MTPSTTTFIPPTPLPFRTCSVPLTLTPHIPLQLRQPQRPRCTAESVLPTNPATHSATTPTTSPVTSTNAQNHTPSPSTARPAIPPNAVPYFAYFSNMNPRVFGPNAASTLRRATPYHTEPALLPDHTLVFDVPGLPPEPAFANLRAQPDAAVHGVLFWLPPRDFDRLCISEGALPPAASSSPLRPLAASIVTPFTVLVGPPDAQEPLEANTFIFRPTPLPDALRNLLRPSRRYVQTAMYGARHYNLPTSCLTALKTVQLAPGPLQAFGLIPPTRPHLLDRPNPDLRFGKPTSEMYSPFRPIHARNAVRVFEEHEPGLQNMQLRLLRLSNTSAARAKLRRPLYFLPGIDGTGKSVVSQVDEMDRAGVYDVHSLIYPFANRQSLPELAAAIADLILADAQGRPVTIVAESMGGVLAMMLAKENAQRRRRALADSISNNYLHIDLLLMINPATCYSRASPNALWDFLLSLGLNEEQYAMLLPPVMLPFIVDLTSARANFGPSIFPRLRKILGALSHVSEVLPQDALNHRLRLLKEFSFRQEDYAEIGGEFGPTDVALISSVNDNLIPSLSENYRLRRYIPNLYSMILPFGGHAPMFDPRFSLDGFLRPFKTGRSKAGSTSPPPVVNSKVLRRREAFRKKFSVDSSKPNPTNKKTREEMRPVWDFLASSRKESAPVFIGEENIPERVEGKPVLFISNHTLLGWWDAMHPVARLLEQNGILVRSLAHPEVMKMTLNQFPGTTSFTDEDLNNFGILPVSPRTVVEQFSQGNWCLLFPGGAREALKQPSDEKYSLHWRESPEFIRSCALFGATIVPVSTIGTEDMINIILDSKSTASLYEAGSKIFGRPVDYDIISRDVARRWQGDEGQMVDRPLFPPLVVPAGTQRLYYRFGKPLEIPTEALDEPELVEKLYADAKSRVSEGVEILKRRREADMYRTVKKRKEFAESYGDDVQPPAGLGWAWLQGNDRYLDDELQPPL